MQRIKDFISNFINKYLSTSKQIQRIILYAGIALVLGLVSFSAYYYFDRYYSHQTTVKEQNLDKAEQAVRDDPSNPDKRVHLAETYMFYLRWDDAIAQALEVQKNYPDNMGSYFVLGIAYANNGHPKDAIEPLKLYIDSQKDAEMPGLNTKLQAALYYLGDSYLQLNQPQEAIEPLLTNINYSQTDADAMYKLGLAYNGVGEYQKAVEVLYKAATFVPDYLEVYQAMVPAFDGLKEPDLVKYAEGMEAYSKKDYSAALAKLLEATAARPDFTPAWVGLGQVYEAQNDLQNAKAAYEAALKLDPSNFTASNNLVRVEALLSK